MGLLEQNLQQFKHQNQKEMINQNEMLLPAEVEQVAMSVSDEKKQEVRSVLNSVFNEVSKMKNQLNAIVVADENDETAMKLANTIRLSVRRQRLDAEKVFDAKRKEVQDLMSEYKTQDQLWLKAKQVMQILTKEIEDQARIKEETKERILAERKEALISKRLSECVVFESQITRSDIEGLSDSSFEIFLSGLKKAHEERIAEAERIERERIEREKKEAEERERIRLENERLRKEREERERQFQEERKKAEEERRKAEEKAKKEREAAELKLRKEREEREKIEAELKAKEDAERKRKADELAKQQAELKAKQEAERKAKAAPDKEKILAFVQKLDEIQLPDVNSEEAKMIVKSTAELIQKTINWTTEKANNL